MASRSTLERLGAAIIGTGLVLVTALPAAADKPKVEPHEGADAPGMGVYLERDGELLDGNKNQDGKQAFNAKLIGLKLTEGGETETAQAYCVELPTSLDNGEDLEEVPWGEHPNPDTKFKENAAKINWILQNSTPQLTIEQASAKYNLPISKPSALIAATQAAIWHFSDGVDLREQDSVIEPVEGEHGDIDDEVYALYKYLVTNAQDLAEPKPTLSIEPGELAGKAGEKIGPFTVAMTADEAVVTAKVPAGVTFVDEKGDPLRVVEEGQMGAASTVKVAQLWVKVDEGVEPGEVEFTVTAIAELRTGRLFVASDRHNTTQSLVIAKSQPVTVKANAKAKWVEAPIVTTTTTATTTTTTEATTTTTAPTSTTTPAPVAGGGNDDDLANTGASIFVPLLIGLGLLGAGAAALLVVRRKRTA